MTHAEDHCERSRIPTPETLQDTVHCKTLLMPLDNCERNGFEHLQRLKRLLKPKASASSNAMPKDGCYLLEIPALATP